MSCVGRKWLKKNVEGVNNDDGSTCSSVPGESGNVWWVWPTVCVLLTEQNELLMLENILNGIIFTISVK